MKTYKGWLFLVGLLWWGAEASADAVTLINTLPQRPVFSYLSSGTVQTRSVAPGQRLFLPSGLFSGLGDKKVPLEPGTVYYMARLGATERLYRLGPGQVLVLNQAGRPVGFRLRGQTVVEGLLAVGTLALGTLEDGADQGLYAEWDEGGAWKSQHLVAGGVYRLVLDSPEGVGTAVALKAWD